ncbi:MAG: RraA family protein [Clostridia bacterium]|nr:RraA family protein [Clostridia bacterium]
MIEHYASANASDALNKTNTMDAAIKSVNPGKRVAGRAYTVDCYPGSIITCHKALGEVKPGQILVINGHGDPSGAMWGGLMSLEAIQRGVAGVIVDGAVRDVNTIRELGLPVFAGHVTPCVGSNRTVGSTGNPIVCGGVIVRTGDLIIADDDGVVVVPEERIEEVLRRVAAIVEKEKDIAEKVRSGAHIADLIGMSDAIAAAGAASKGK